MAPDGLTVGEVARRLDIPVTTLRTWHRRYGLGPTGHQPHQHRRYGVQDLARLRIMRQLTDGGMPAVEAARTAIAAPAAPAPTAAPPATGRVIAVDGARRAARKVIRAAEALDGQRVAILIAAAIDGMGVVATWNHLLCPALAAIGSRHAATGDLIEVEHLLSRLITEAFAEVRRGAGPPSRTLLACTGHEQHTLPIEAFAAALAEHGHSSLLLGASVPRTALANAVRRTGPVIVLLWSQTPATGDAGQLTALAGLAQPVPLVIAAGPGWDPADIPAAVARPASLGEAVALALRFLPVPSE